MNPRGAVMLRAGFVVLAFAGPVMAQDIGGKRFQLDPPVEVHRLRFADGNRLLVLAGDVSEYDWRTGSVTKFAEIPSHANPNCSDISPNGSAVAVCDGSMIRLVNTAGGAVVHE